MNWLIIYTIDFDQTRQQAYIKASNYTQAYLTFVLHNKGTILELIKI